MNHVHFLLVKTLSRQSSKKLLIWCSLVYLPLTELPQREESPVENQPRLTRSTRLSLVGLS